MPIVTNENSKFISKTSYGSTTLPTVSAVNSEGNLNDMTININWDALAKLSETSSNNNIVNNIIEYKDNSSGTSKKFSLVLDSNTVKNCIKRYIREDPDKSPIIIINNDKDYHTPDENNNLVLSIPKAVSALDPNKILDLIVSEMYCDDNTKILIYRAEEEIGGIIYESEYSIPVFSNQLSNYKPPILKCIKNCPKNNIIIVEDIENLETKLDLPVFTAINFKGKSLEVNLEYVRNDKVPNILYLIYSTIDEEYNVRSEKVITVYRLPKEQISGPVINIVPEITHLVPASSGKLFLPNISAIDYKGCDCDIDTKFVQDMENPNLWNLEIKSTDDLDISSSKVIKINAIHPYKLKDMPPIIELASGDEWVNFQSIEKSKEGILDINIPTVVSRDRYGNNLKTNKDFNYIPEQNIWSIEFTATDNFGFTASKTTNIATKVNPLLVSLDSKTDIDTENEKYVESGVLLLDKYASNKIVNADEIDENKDLLSKIKNSVVGNYNLNYKASGEHGFQSKNSITKKIKLYDNKNHFIAFDFSDNTFNDNINGYKYTNKLHQKKSVSEILTDTATKQIISDTVFSREIFLKTENYETDLSAQNNNNVMQLTENNTTTGFKISFIEELKGVIDTISFDSNITTIKYNSLDPFKIDNFNTNINRLYFKVDIEVTKSTILNFIISKNLNDKVLLNNIVIKFKKAPIYYIIDKDFKDIDSNTLESNEEFMLNNLKKDTMFKDNENDKKILKKFIEKVNSFSSLTKSKLTKDDLNLNDTQETKYLTNDIEVLTDKNKNISNKSFLVIPDEKKERKIFWDKEIKLGDSYKDNAVNDNKRIVVNKSLGEGVILYDIVDSFILGKSMETNSEEEKFNEMVTKHVNKDNKKDFYNHAKTLKKHKFTIAKGSITNLVTKGSERIFDSVIDKEDYPFESREYLYMSPSDEIVSITSDEFNKIKKRDMVIYLGMNNDDEIKFKMNNTMVKIKQKKDDIDKYTINNDTDISFTDKVFNVGKYRFEMVFSGSLGIQLAGVHKSGIGGDPYIQPLLGERFKIPYGVNNYKYLDNNNSKDRFLINFSTFILKGDQLKNLNNFVLSTIMKRKNLHSIKDTAKMLCSKGLALDTNACFMDKIYIKNGEQEMYFDLNKFRVVDKNGNNIGLPFGFKPVKVRDININESIGQHIVISKEKPIATLRIETYTNSYGLVSIDLMKFNHPQIRSAINVQTDIPLNNNNCTGAIISETNILINNLESINELKKEINSRKIIEEVYIDNKGEYLINNILE